MDTARGRLTLWTRPESAKGLSRIDSAFFLPEDSCELGAQVTARNAPGDRQRAYHSVFTTPVTRRPSPRTSQEAV